MAKKKRFMDTSKGYSRAAQKAVTMAVVEEDYYEEMLDSRNSGDALFRVSEEEREQAASTALSEDRANGRPEPATHTQQPESGSDGSASGQAHKKSGLLGRLFGALRNLG